MELSKYDKLNGAELLNVIPYNPMIGDYDDKHFELVQDIVTNTLHNYNYDAKLDISNYTPFLVFTICDCVDVLREVQVRFPLHPLIERRADGHLVIDVGCIVGSALRVAKMMRSIGMCNYFQPVIAFKRAELRRKYCKYNKGGEIIKDEYIYRIVVNYKREQDEKKEITEMRRYML